MSEATHRRDMLSTGSTLLNLACSTNPFGGFLTGKYYFFVGDSESGKTFICMTCFAEATINPHFKKYRLIYDNPEDGMLLNVEELFNEEVADRIEPPAVRNGKPAYSETIEQFYYNLDNAVQQGTPFIYVLDSMDAIDSDAAIKKFNEHKKAYMKRAGAEVEEDEEGGKEDKKLAGSYGDGKAKKNSEGLRKVMKGLRDTGSVLIIISQTRDNLGGYGKTRGGGHALRFYATNEIWSSVVKPITKEVLGKKRKIGTRVKLQVRKNRQNGQHAEVEIDFYPTAGIDDVGTMVDYLVEEGHWRKSGNTIKAEGLKIEGTKEKLIRVIERKGLEDKVREQCAECWEKITAACAVHRKNKYQAATPAAEALKETQ